LLEAILARTADPKLEAKVTRAALRLLDKEGMSALSMRAVAKAARTTTPTLYDRFENHENLLAAITKRINEELLGRIAAQNSIESMILECVQYAASHPYRYELLYKQRAKIWATDEPKPVFEALKKQLAVQLKMRGAALDETGLALMALMHGSSVFRIAMGPNSAAHAEVEKATSFAVRRIVRESRRTK